MIIREARSFDAPAVEALSRAAFGGAYEAELIENLRRDGLVAASLVAESDGAVVGYICFSWLPTTLDGRDVRAVALAPLAVAPDRQRRGVGSRLIVAGLESVRSAGAEAAIVLGHPDYYPRFGFSAVLAAKLASPFSGEAFMALELVPSALQGSRGSVIYPAAFGL